MVDVQQVAETLLARGQTVSVAEACTNGLLGYTLGTIPGASRFFPGGIVAYTGGLKEKILGVPDELYETAGSVSREMALAMARGALDLTGTDYALSTTGVTGPAAGRSGLPIGTFWIGLAVKGRRGCGYRDPGWRRPRRHQARRGPGGHRPAGQPVGGEWLKSFGEWIPNEIAMRRSQWCGTRLIAKSLGSSRRRCGSDDGVAATPDQRRFYDAVRRVPICHGPAAGRG